MPLDLFKNITISAQFPVNQFTELQKEEICQIIKNTFLQCVYESPHVTFTTKERYALLSFQVAPPFLYHAKMVIKAIAYSYKYKDSFELIAK